VVELLLYGTMDVGMNAVCAAPLGRRRGNSAVRIGLTQLKLEVLDLE
jgi:hypothetical protein